MTTTKLLICPSCGSHDMNFYVPIIVTQNEDGTFDFDDEPDPWDSDQLIMCAESNRGFIEAHCNGDCGWEGVAEECNVRTVQTEAS